MSTSRSRLHFERIAFQPSGHTCQGPTWRCRSIPVTQLPHGAPHWRSRCKRTPPNCSRSATADTKTTCHGNMPIFIGDRLLHCIINRCKDNEFSEINLHRPFTQLIRVIVCLHKSFTTCHFLVSSLWTNPITFVIDRFRKGSCLR